MTEDTPLVSALKTAGLATAAGVGVGLLLYYAKTSAEAERRREASQGWVTTGFQTHRKDIIDYCLEQSWNNFDKKVLQRVWWYFGSHLPRDNKQRGIMSEEKFMELMREDGIEDHKQLHRLYQFASMKKQVGFLEVCQRLNLICNYPLTDVLSEFFDIVDLSGDGLLDHDELKVLFHTFYGFGDQAAKNHVATLLRNHNTRRMTQTTHDELSRQDFSNLALRQDFDPRDGPFIRTFLKQFGLTAENIQS